MSILALGIERVLDVTVQRLHDPDPRHHRRTALRHQHQHRDRRLPFRQVGFLLRQAGDVVGGVTKRDELSPAGQWYQILEFAPPASRCLGLVLNQQRDLKYKLISQGPHETRLRSIKPSAAICCKLCLMLAADHIPNCLQSNRPETAFSSPTGTSFKSSLDMDIHTKCRLATTINRPNQPNIRTECHQELWLPLPYKELDPLFFNGRAGLQFRSDHAERFAI